MKKPTVNIDVCLLDGDMGEGMNFRQNKPEILSHYF